MSDTARPKSVGNKMSADEVNKDLPVVLNAGDTIDGATLPVPVYVHTDGELYACDANVTTKLNYIGFAVSDSTDGNPIQLQKDGVVSGFTGLTIGSKYYVQDAVGTVGLVPGTYNILVGVAISATQILILKSPGIYVNAGTTVTRGLSTSNLDTPVSFDVGFVPRYFEAIVQLDIVFFRTWGVSDGASLGVQSVFIKGIIGGTSDYFYTHYDASGGTPNATPARNPFLDFDSGQVLASSNPVRPTYGSGSTSSISLSSASEDGKTITLDSITIDGNDIDFNFLSSQSGGNCDVRYGVKHLSVWE